jgi:tetratricopeptide (TPR) repeat protein
MLAENCHPVFLSLHKCWALLFAICTEANSSLSTLAQAATSPGSSTLLNNPTFQSYAFIKLRFRCSLSCTERNPTTERLWIDGCEPRKVKKVDMSLQMLDHEETILRDLRDAAPVSLERALLVLSGLKTEEQIRSYHHKIDAILDRFLNKHDYRSPYTPSPPPAYLHLSIAKNLFEYLWTSKPKRFGEYFLLTDVIDAQLDSDVHRVVGTCVGLTSLYSVLGLRMSLNLYLLVDLDHLLSRVRAGPQTIDIDHTDPQGFDCHNYKGFREFPLLSLTANVLNSRGLKYERSGNFVAAKADYQKAILVNPEYANAFNNRGNMRLWDEDIAGAIADYTDAIRLNPCFCEAYCNRGMAKHRLGRYEEARQDYAMAMNTNSEYGDVRKCLQLLDDIEHGNPPAARRP